MDICEGKDEKALKVLLDESVDFEERRKLRSAIRDLRNKRFRTITVYNTPTPTQQSCTFSSPLSAHSAVQAKTTNVGGQASSNSNSNKAAGASSHVSAAILQAPVAEQVKAVKKAQSFKDSREYLYIDNTGSSNTDSGKVHNKVSARNFLSNQLSFLGNDNTNLIIPGSLPIGRSQSVKVLASKFEASPSLGSVSNLLQEEDASRNTKLLSSSDGLHLIGKNHGNNKTDAFPNTNTHQVNGHVSTVNKLSSSDGIHLIRNQPGRKDISGNQLKSSSVVVESELSIPNGNIIVGRTQSLKLSRDSAPLVPDNSAALPPRGSLAHSYNGTSLRVMGASDSDLSRNKREGAGVGAAHYSSTAELLVGNGRIRPFVKQRESRAASSPVHSQVSAALEKRGVGDLQGHQNYLREIAHPSFRATSSPVQSEVRAALVNHQGKGEEGKSAGVNRAGSFKQPVINRIYESGSKEVRRSSSLRKSVPLYIRGNDEENQTNEFSTEKGISPPTKAVSGLVNPTVKRASSFKNPTVSAKISDEKQVRRSNSLRHSTTPNRDLNDDASRFKSVSGKFPSTERIEVMVNDEAGRLKTASRKFPSTERIETVLNVDNVNGHVVGREGGSVVSTASIQSNAFNGSVNSEMSNNMDKNSVNAVNNYIGKDILSKGEISCTQGQINVSNTSKGPINNASTVHSQYDTAETSGILQVQISTDTSAVQAHFMSMDTSGAQGDFSADVSGIEGELGCGLNNVSVDTSELDEVLDQINTSSHRRRSSKLCTANPYEEIEDEGKLNELLRQAVDLDERINIRAALHRLRQHPITCTSPTRESTSPSRHITSPTRHITSPTGGRHTTKLAQNKADILSLIQTTGSDKENSFSGIQDEKMADRKTAESLSRGGSVERNSIAEDGDDVFSNKTDHVNNIHNQGQQSRDSSSTPPTSPDIPTQYNYIQNEDELQNMLNQTSDYFERKKIRTALTSLKRKNSLAEVEKLKVKGKHSLRSKSAVFPNNSNDPLDNNLLHHGDHHSNHNTLDNNRVIDTGQPFTGGGDGGNKHIYRSTSIDANRNTKDGSHYKNRQDNLVHNDNKMSGIEETQSVLHNTSSNDTVLQNNTTNKAVSHSTGKSDTLNNAISTHHKKGGEKTDSINSSGNLSTINQRNNNHQGIYKSTDRYAGITQGDVELIRTDSSQGLLKQQGSGYDNQDIDTLEVVGGGTSVEENTYDNSGVSAQDGVSLKLRSASDNTQDYRDNIDTDSKIQYSNIDNIESSFSRDSPARKVKLNRGRVLSDSAKLTGSRNNRVKRRLPEIPASALANANASNRGDNNRNNNENDSTIKTRFGSYSSSSEWMMDRRIEDNHSKADGPSVIERKMEDLASKADGCSGEIINGVHPYEGSVVNCNALLVEDKADTLNWNTGDNVIIKDKIDCHNNNNVVNEYEDIKGMVKSSSGPYHRQDSGNGNKIILSTSQNNIISSEDNNVINTIVDKSDSISDSNRVDSSSTSNNIHNENNVKNASSPVRNTGTTGIGADFGSLESSFCSSGFKSGGVSVLHNNNNAMDMSGSSGVVISLREDSSPGGSGTPTSGVVISSNGGGAPTEGRGRIPSPMGSPIPRLDIGGDEEEDGGITEGGLDEQKEEKNKLKTLDELRDELDNLEKQLDKSLDFEERKQIRSDIRQVRTLIRDGDFVLQTPRYVQPPDTIPSARIQKVNSHNTTQSTQDPKGDKLQPSTESKKQACDNNNQKLSNKQSGSRTTKSCPFHDSDNTKNSDAFIVNQGQVESKTINGGDVNNDNEEYIIVDIVNGDVVVDDTENNEDDGNYGGKTTKTIGCHDDLNKTRRNSVDMFEGYVDAETPRIEDKADIVKTQNMLIVKDADVVLSNHKQESSHTKNQEDDIPEVLLPLSDMIAIDGESSCLSCKIRAPQGAEVTWYRETRLLKDTPEFIHQREGDLVTLLIPEVFPDDEGEYRCVAKANGGEAETSCYLLVKGNSKSGRDSQQVILDKTIIPVQSNRYRWRTRLPKASTPRRKRRVRKNKLAVLPCFSTPLQDQSAQKRGQVVFRCQFAGRPTPRIYWYHDVELLKNHHEVKQEVKGEWASLTIPQVFSEDGGTYTCAAKNVAGETKSSATLTVIGKTQVEEKVEEEEVDSGCAPEVTLTTDYVDLQQGDALTLTCQVTGSPEPGVVWKKDNKLLHSGTDYNIDFTDSQASLVVYKVEGKHAGAYECVANNSLGSASVSAVVSVKVPTPIKRSASSHHYKRASYHASTDALHGRQDTNSINDNSSIYSNSNRHSLGSSKLTDEDSALKRCNSLPVKNRQFPAKTTGKDDDDGSIKAAQLYKSESVSLNLDAKSNKVVEPPRILQPLADREEITLEKPFCLECRFNFLSKATVAWFKDGIELPRVGRIKWSVDNACAKLWINRASKGDVGGYKVLIKNSAGEVGSRCQVKLKQEPISVVPTSCNMPGIRGKLQPRQVNEKASNLLNSVLGHMITNKPEEEQHTLSNQGNRRYEDHTRHLVNLVKPHRGNENVANERVTVHSKSMETLSNHYNHIEEPEPFSKQYGDLQTVHEHTELTMSSQKVEEMEDEEALHKLMNNTENFDERKKIRARLREIRELKAAEYEARRQERESTREDAIKMKLRQAEQDKARRMKEFSDMAKAPRKEGSVMEDSIRERHAAADKEKKKKMEDYKEMSSVQSKSYHAGSDQIILEQRKKADAEKERKMAEFAEDAVSRSTKTENLPGGTMTTTTTKTTHTTKDGSTVVTKESKQISQSAGIGGTSYVITKTSADLAAQNLYDTFSNQALEGTNGLLVVKTEEWSSKDGVTRRNEKTKTWGGKKEAPKSAMAAFKQLDGANPRAKRGSTSSSGSVPSSPTTPLTPTSPHLPDDEEGGSDKVGVQRSPSTVKEVMLAWAKKQVEGYPNVHVTNFSSSWNDGMAFCALIHRFHPETFDFKKLDPKRRRANFTLAFNVAEKVADIAPLLDVDDMVKMKNPDWKCVFTCVQGYYRKFRDSEKAA